MGRERFETAEPVARGPMGERFSFLRDWQVSAKDARTRSNVLFYYRLEWNGRMWVMDWEASRSHIMFWTNAEVAAQNAYAITRAYSRRHPCKGRLDVFQQSPWGSRTSAQPLAKRGWADKAKAIAEVGAPPAMKFQGAVIEEQQQKFAVVIVKPHVLSNRSEAARLQQGFALVFGGIPVVLMAQDMTGRPTYLGRPDIARFLASIDVRRIPWKEYTLS
jgi:hypothetical protein